MDVLRNFLINAIYYFKLLFKKPDYKVLDSQLEYWVDLGKDYVTQDDFWEGQSEEWDAHTESYYVPINNIDKIPPPPEIVTKTLIRIKYWYNNHMYKFLTYNRDYTWPPVISRGVQFNIPLQSAQLINEKGEPVKDILAKIKRYAGPNGDFHGQKIKIADMLYYDEETLKSSYPKMSIKNIFGLTKTVSTTDGYISDLRIP